MLQIKKKLQKSSEKELDEMESTKIPDAEFKTIVIRMLKDLRRRIDDLSRNVNKKIVSIKKDLETIKKRTIQR